MPFKLAPAVTALLLFMVDGHPQDVAVRVGRLGEILPDQGGATTVLKAGDATEADKLWAARRVISPATFKVRPNKVSEDVAVPLGAIPALVAGVEEIGRARGLRTISYGHAGDGNIHVNIMFDQQSAQRA